MKPLSLMFVSMALLESFAGASDSWPDLGGGSSGVSGTPTLSGTGVFEFGESVTLNLAQAKATAPAFLFLSTSSNPVPLGAGLLKAFPSVGAPIAIGLTTSNTGTIPISAVVPAGFPLGVPLYCQYVVADAAGAAGVALSNAVRAFTPSVDSQISGFSPASGYVGTPIAVSGDFFGTAPKNICALMLSQLGEVVGYTNVTAASETGFTTTLVAVTPNATVGKIMALVGDGDSTPVVPSPGFTLPTAPWTFFGEGNAAVAPSNFTFTPPPGPPPASCQYIFGKHNPALSRYELTLPFKTTDLCAQASVVTIDFHANFPDGSSVHVDSRCAVSPLVATPGLACADEIRKCYNNKIDAHVFALWPSFPLKYKIECVISPDTSTGDIVIYFPDAPGGTSGGNKYTSVSFYVQVCQ